MGKRYTLKKALFNEFFTIPHDPGIIGVDGVVLPKTKPTRSKCERQWENSALGRKRSSEQFPQ
eukprot:4153260-Amphidinium_carterae.1